MALTELQLDLIGRYVSNTLSKSELTDFEENLNLEIFRNELLLQGKLVDALSEAHDESLKKYLNEKTYKLNNKKRFFKEPFIKYAAVFILLVGSFFVFKQITGKSNINTISLIHDYNATYPSELLQRGNASELTDDYKAALALYANQKYEEALMAFERLQENSAKVKLYKANIFIELSQYDKAIDLLSEEWQDSQNIISGNEILQNQEWYLAIALLGENRIDEANKILQRIEDNDSHLFKAKVKKLLEKLK